MSKLFHPLELFVGLRYTRARRQSHFVSFISFASMIGIAIGVLVLITVLSVMNGFEQAMRDRMLSMLAHVTVSETDARLENWQDMRQQLIELPEVEGVSPFVEKSVMVSQGDEARGVLLQGIEPELEKQVAAVFEHVEQGDMNTLTPGSYGIALGAALADDLDVSLGDSVTLISPPEDIMASSELPVLRRFIVQAIFRIDMQIYDEGFAYVNIEDASDILEMERQVTGLRLRLTDANRAPAASEDVLMRLGEQYPDIWVSDWTYQNTGLFTAIKMQKSVMFIILLLIIAVAAFNLVSTLVMVVTDKEADIAILRTLGLSPARIMKIFMVQGTLIGVIGTMAGIILGVLLAANLDVIVPLIERMFDTDFISPDTYFISELESRINPWDVLVIGLSSLFMSICATLYPAWRASKVQPAEALRYE
uniref:Lipoprotein releasing system transmembrane protein LolC n=1 Tax=uncultured Thiotrichaceae bacterium TaxID=298394 RepID=A0A6S6S079_9GAMM|nr:MAG: Lipoprotein releasing system transmembrane protein LolC [uncultured Thiotrichaceae bacterium]